MTSCAPEFEGCSQCPSYLLIIAHNAKSLIRKISGALNSSLHFLQNLGMTFKHILSDAS